MSVVGEGEFGVVMKADAYKITATAQWSTVAVKMLRSASYQFQQLLYCTDSTAHYVLALFITLACEVDTLTFIEQYFYECMGVIYCAKANGNIRTSELPTLYTLYFCLCRKRKESILVILCISMLCNRMLIIACKSNR